AGMITPRASLREVTPHTAAIAAQLWPAALVKRTRVSTGTGARRWKKTASSAAGSSMPGRIAKPYDRAEATEAMRGRCGSAGDPTHQAATRRAGHDRLTLCDAVRQCGRAPGQVLIAADGWTSHHLAGQDLGTPPGVVGGPAVAAADPAGHAA